MGNLYKSNNFSDDRSQITAVRGPVFESDFQQWTGKPFSGKWTDDFELMSIEIPREADETNEWTVGYYVDAAKHYFTARFIDGKPTYNEIDG